MRRLEPIVKFKLSEFDTWQQVPLVHMVPIIFLKLISNTFYNSVYLLTIISTLLDLQEP